VRNAGGIFVGECCSEALGDYVVGPSHIMPTGGTARFSSPINVWDYCKITSIFGLGADAVRDLTAAGMTIAQEEGLTAHARAMHMRLEGKGANGVAARRCGAAAEGEGADR